MKRLAIAVLAAFILVAAVVVINAARSGSRQITVARNDEAAPAVADAARRLAEAIRFRTISSKDAKTPSDEFTRFHAFLVRSFPHVQSALRKQVVNGLSLVYEWPGSDPSLKPILVMAHQDVVPVDPTSADKWRQPAFDGIVSGGFIWGRGALDDKGALMALHEAAEALLAQGFRPKRSVYFAFGHDEETGGREGAAKIAQWLAQQNVRFESVLDEGQVVTQGIVPGVDKPVALIGIAEKGYLSLELLVEGEGGHSSMPPPQTAVGILSAAIARLESHPFPGSISEPVRQQFAFLGPEQGWLKRALFANLWLFGPIVRAQMDKAPSTSAMLRTTIAPTMLEGSIKENVLPMRARGVVNFRLLPGMSGEDAIRRVEGVVADPRVKIVVTGSSRSEPSPVSDTDGEAFAKLHRTVKATFPDAIVVPSLLLGATDTRHFISLSDSIFRFLPARLGREDLKRYHGVDERIGVENYEEFIRFYMRYLREAGG
ncbi:MAG TPA: M20 family peptidase [Burkholderiales bacterium]|nr:M20 family peptidase [Burkholderiales bacterium]